MRTLQLGTRSALFFILFLALAMALTSCEVLAPDFTLTDIDGKVFTLSQFRGKIVLLDFFATYCGPCRDEMRQLRTVQNSFPDIVIISLSVWEKDTDTVLKQFRINYSISWILARDTKNLYDIYGCTGIPTVFLIDWNGYIRARYLYPNASTLMSEITHISQSTCCRVHSGGEVVHG